MGRKESIQSINQFITQEKIFCWMIQIIDPY